MERDCAVEPRRCECGAPLRPGEAVCEFCLLKARENFETIQLGGPPVYYNAPAPTAEDKTLAVHYMEGAKRSKAARWTAKGRAVVEHPRYGVAEVPCTSPAAAIACAAEAWGCEAENISTARVRAI